MEKLKIILYIIGILLLAAFIFHRNYCENSPIKITGRRIRYVKNYKNRLRAQVKFPIWGWIDVTNKKIKDSIFDSLPEFKTEGEVEIFLNQLKESNNVYIEKYIRDYSGKKHFSREEKE